MPIVEITLRPEHAAQAFDLEETFSRTAEVFSPAEQAARTSAIYCCARAATAFGARNYEKALSTAKEAIQLDPTFANAHFFLAGVYHVQRNFVSAAVSLNTAASLTGSAEEHFEWRVLLDKYCSDAGVPPPFRLKDGESQYHLPLIRLVELQTEGHHFRIDSAVVRTAYTQSRLLRAWEIHRQFRICPVMPKPNDLVQQQDIPPEPKLEWMPGEITMILNEVILDPEMSFVYQTVNVFKNPRELLFLQYKAERYRSALPPRGSNLGTFIAHIERTVANVGWDDTFGVKGATGVLEAIIAIEFLDAWSLEAMTGDYGPALHGYYKALSIIEKALEKWPDQRGPAGLGTYCNPPFVRILKCRIIQCRTARFLTEPWSQGNENMLAMERLANEVLDSCKKHPWNMPSATAAPREVIEWVAFQKVHTAEANLCLGFVSHRRADQHALADGQQVMLHPQHGRIALFHFLAAAAWCPDGDQKKIKALLSAAQIATHIGDVSLATLDALLEAADQTQEQAELILMGDPMADALATCFKRDKIIPVRNRMAYLGKKCRINDPSKIFLRAMPIALDTVKEIEDAVRIRTPAQLRGSGLNDSILDLLQTWKAEDRI